jgi:hypothetical protein
MLQWQQLDRILPIVRSDLIQVCRSWDLKVKLSVTVMLA